jgi:hypothetical protein
MRKSKHGSFNQNFHLTYCGKHSLVSLILRLHCGSKPMPTGLLYPHRTGASLSPFQNRCKSGKAFEICDIPDGRGGSAKGFILWNPLQDQAVDVDGDTIRSRVTLKAAEKHDFLTIRTVEVCKKSHFNSSFKANISDFGRWSNKIREKYFGVIVILRQVLILSLNCKGLVA